MTTKAEFLLIKVTHSLSRPIAIDRAGTLGRVHVFTFETEGRDAAVAVDTLQGLAEADVFPVYVREVARILGVPAEDVAAPFRECLNKEIAH